MGPFQSRTFYCVLFSVLANLARDLAGPKLQEGVQPTVLP